MSTGVVVLSTLVLVGCVAFATFIMARRLGKASNQKAIMEAQKRMDSVTVDTKPGTAKRLRNGDF